jgi:signal transduction histidine kinase
VDELRQQANQDLAKLAPTAEGAEDVRAMITEFWATLDRAAGVPGPNAYDFINREIVPRRSAANLALLELRRAGHAAVEHSELEFVQGRRAAGRNILVLLGVSLLIGAAVAVISIRRTEKLEEELLRNYERVAEARRELQQLSMRLIEIQEEERGRLSRELHDEIGQILTAVRIEISRSLPAACAASPEAAERLARARELMERAVKTVRNISLLLRPSALDDFGLIPALQWQIEDFSRRSGIRCEFIEQGVADALPDAVKTCAYRAVQEALHNCEKHSAATAVTVRITQAADFLNMVVEDNGYGVDLGSAGLPLKREGSGLLGMRERIGLLGGEFIVRSSRGAGFSLSIQIPLATAAKEGTAAAAGGENA